MLAAFLAFPAFPCFSTPRNQINLEVAEKKNTMEKAKNLDESNEQFGETMEKIYSLLVESGVPDAR